MTFIFLLCRIININVAYPPESENAYHHNRPNLPILPVQIELKVAEGYASMMKGELYPTITTDMVRMRFMLPVDTRVSVKVYNTLGQLVEYWTWHLTRGVHKFDWRTCNLPSGIYFIYLESPNRRLSNKIVVLH